MILTVKTNLGNIIVNGNVIAKVIIKAAAKTEDRVILSNAKGKTLGVASKLSSGDMAGNFVMEEIDGKYHLDFFGVIRFGSSISGVSKTILDSVEAELKEMFPDKGAHITFHIVGIKSKQLALRNIEVTRDYEASR